MGMRYILSQSSPYDYEMDYSQIACSIPYLLEYLDARKVSLYDEQNHFKAAILRIARSTPMCATPERWQLCVVVEIKLGKMVTIGTSTNNTQNIITRRQVQLCSEEIRHHIHEL